MNDLALLRLSRAILCRALQDVAKTNDDELVAEALAWLLDDPNEFRELILEEIAGPAQSDIQRYVEKLFREDT
jgi:hypothetical protein